MIQDHQNGDLGGAGGPAVTGNAATPVFGSGGAFGAGVTGGGLN